MKLKGKYRHFKGGEYKVLVTALHTDTEEELVIYQDLNDSKKIWARPVREFVGTKILEDGTEIQRFEKIK